MNLGEFVPMGGLPTELRDKVIQAIKEDHDPYNKRKPTFRKEKTAKRETMSDVSKRYG